MRRLFFLTGQYCNWIIEWLIIEKKKEKWGSTFTTSDSLRYSESPWGFWKTFSFGAAESILTEGFMKYSGGMWIHRTALHIWCSFDSYSLLWFCVLFFIAHKHKQSGTSARQIKHLNLNRLGLVANKSHFISNVSSAA